MKTYRGYVRFSTLMDNFSFVAKDEEAAEEYMWVTSRIEYETYRKLFDCPSYADCVAEMNHLEDKVNDDKTENYYNAVIDSFVDYWFEEVEE